jgi:hypothetical protein
VLRARRGRPAVGRKLAGASSRVASTRLNPPSQSKRVGHRASTYGDKDRSLLSGVLDYTAAAAGAGGLVYALIAFAYERFYGAFGLAPKDVGITVAGLIQRTAVAFSAFLVVAVAGLALMVAAWTLTLKAISMAVRRARPQTGNYVSLQPTPGVILALSALTASIVAPLAISQLVASVIISPMFLRDTATVTGLTFGGSLLTLAVLLLHPARTPRRTLFLSATWLFVSAATFFTLIAASNARASSLAESTLRGQEGASTLIFNFRADPVCVHREGDPNESKGNFRLYLGEADGWLALYDPTTSQTTRMSREGVELTYIAPSGVDTC